MTEEKDKKLESLLETITQDISSLKKWKSEQLQSTEKPISSKKEHSHSSNVLFDCPECQKEYDLSVIEKAKPEIVKETIKEEREKLKKGELVVCDDCGELVYEETEECPTCKGRNAHRATIK